MFASLCPCPVSPLSHTHCERVDSTLMRMAGKSSFKIILAAICGGGVFIGGGGGWHFQLAGKYIEFFREISTCLVGRQWLIAVNMYILVKDNVYANLWSQIWSIRIQHMPFNTGLCSHHWILFYCLACELYITFGVFWCCIHWYIHYICCIRGVLAIYIIEVWSSDI